MIAFIHKLSSYSSYIIFTICLVNSIGLLYPDTVTRKRLFVKLLMSYQA